MTVPTLSVTMQAYCFDDGVLFDLGRAQRMAGRIAVEELWARVGTPEAQALTVDHVLEVQRQVADELIGRVSSDPQLTLAGFERILEEVGVYDEPGLALQVDAMYREHRDRVAEPFPDALGLATLRQRYRLGLVVSGEIDWRVLGEGIFDSVLQPASVGLDRADARVVEKMAGRLGCRPEDLGVVTVPGSALGRAARRAGAELIEVDRIRGEGLRDL